MQRIVVSEKSELYTYLRNNMKDKSKNNIKSLLTRKNILVNNKIVTKYNYKLQKNDIILIDDKKTKDVFLNIIYEDNNIIVIDKPFNLLTIANNKEKDRTLYRMVSSYLKKENSKVFIIHRLDRDTSGIVMFAKSPRIQKLYQNDWNSIAKVREYTAVVEGITNENGHIESYLRQTKTKQVYSSDKKDGYFSITEYERLKHNKIHSLLKIHIFTGRRNQIRCHMSDIGHPIVGDKRYNAKTNPIHRLALHANRLEIMNPLTKKMMIFTSTVPKDFDNLIKNNR